MASARSRGPGRAQGWRGPRPRRSRDRGRARAADRVTRNGTGRGSGRPARCSARPWFAGHVQHRQAGARGDVEDVAGFGFRRAGAQRRTHAVRSNWAAARPKLGNGKRHGNPCGLNTNVGKPTPRGLKKAFLETCRGVNMLGNGPARPRRRRRVFRALGRRLRLASSRPGRRHAAGSRRGVLAHGPAALATIVALGDGGPRPVGTQMVFGEGGRAGFLSGGCIEGRRRGSRPGLHRRRPAPAPGL